MVKLCSPAIIYLMFSITQILIDTIKGLYNTALMKCVVTTMVTMLLHILCERGLSVVSWFIVFIPFFLMTVIVSMLLYVFGLDAASGTLNTKCGNDSSTTKCGDDITIDSLGNIIIYDPEYLQTNNRVYYQSPNIIIPNPHNNDHNPDSVTIVKTPSVPSGSSDPAYQS